MSADPLSSQQPEQKQHEIDWSQWSRPGKDDVRSPCPALNALANHNILPHNGKDITKAMAMDALTRVLSMGSEMNTPFAAFVHGALAANPAHTLFKPAHTFDLNHLDKHGYIEHDVSLSRDDAALGSNSAFSPERFATFFEALKAEATHSGNEPLETSWAAASHARYARMLESKARHEAAGKPWEYGLKEAVFSYGESALYLNLLGKDGVAPVEWVRIFFEEERFPYAEGWRPPTEFTQSMMNHGLSELTKANEHKAEEAKAIGVGTVESMWQGVLSWVKWPTLHTDQSTAAQDHQQTLVPSQVA